MTSLPKHGAEYSSHRNSLNTSGKSPIPFAAGLLCARANVAETSVAVRGAVRENHLVRLEPLCTFEWSYDADGRVSGGYVLASRSAATMAPGRGKAVGP
jgi:hypothetical protein